MKEEEMKVLLERCCDGEKVDIKKLLELAGIKDTEEIYIKIKSV